MRHRSIVQRVALAGVAAALLAACGSAGDGAGKDVRPGTLEPVAYAGTRLPPAKGAPVAATVEGMQSFAADLYRIAASPNENLVFSPLSIEYAFAMLRAGAAGNSAKQLDDTFGFPIELAAAFNALTANLVTDQAPPPPTPPPAGDKPEGRDYPRPSAPVLAVSNGLFAQRGYQFVQEFLQTLREQYDAGLQTVDFADEAAALAAINGWVEEKTGGRITKALERLDPMTRLAIANAVYLKASWPVPFGDPRDGQFKVAGEQVAIPTVSRESTFDYATGSGWRSLTLPYFGDRLAMRLILPTGQGTPADLMKPEILAAAAKGKPTDVKLTMPTWDFGADLDLRELLPKLGLTDVFDELRANLSGITASEALFVDQAVHKANITVDQLGTEAAAVTVLTTMPTSARAVPPVQFTVDRPFLFQIVDLKTGAPLFLGQVVDPTKK